MSSPRQNSLPDSIEVEGETLQLQHRYKSDWVSAVGRYTGVELDVILKVYRARPLFWVLPVRWFTRRMAAREVRILNEVQVLDGVPREFGVWNETGMLHEFVEGHPLQKDEPVRPDFFELLHALIGEIHARDIAFVDLSKRDNVLVDEAGKPCLTDFQIAWEWPTSGLIGALLPNILGRSILRRMQAGDLRHLLKHQRRVSPESLTQEQHESLANPGLLLRTHRLLLRPYQKWRRRRQRARELRPR